MCREFSWVTSRYTGRSLVSAACPPPPPRQKTHNPLQPRLSCCARTRARWGARARPPKGTTHTQQHAAGPPEGCTLNHQVDRRGPTRASASVTNLMKRAQPWATSPLCARTPTKYTAHARAPRQPARSPPGRALKSSSSSAATIEGGKMAHRLLDDIEPDPFWAPLPLTNTKHKTQNTKHKTQNTTNKTQNEHKTKKRTGCCGPLETRARRR